MQIQCRYCGSYIKDTDAKCPCCGATNEDLNRSAHDTPRTISELQQWYVARKLPPYEVTRFFIGENRREAKCFGIYEDEYGNFVVYKNKADGTRAVRYEGRDEAYAVNELYMRIKEEILNQKSYNQHYSSNSHNTVYRRQDVLDSVNSPQAQRARKIVLFIILGWFGMQVVLPLLAVLIFLPVYFNSSVNDYGYYHYNGAIYCHSDDYWAKYNDSDDYWEQVDALSIKRKDLDDYYIGSTWHDKYNNEYDVSVTHVLSDELWYRKAIDNRNVTYRQTYSWTPDNNSYYQYEDDTYYYLSYDNSSKWYRYDNDEWVIVDSKTIDDDLYYYSDKYLATFSDVSARDGFLDFKDTDYYTTYSNWTDSHHSSYNNSYDNDSYDYNDYNNSWDNDNDYNWDSNDSWDYDDSDWDSDW